MPAPSSSSDPMPRGRQEQGSRSYISRSQYSAGSKPNRPLCPKCGRAHSGECWGEKRVCSGVVTWVTELEIVHRMDKGVVTIALRPRLRLLVLQFQRLAQPQLRAPLLAMLAGSARIDSMLYRPARNRRTLF